MGEGISADDDDFEADATAVSFPPFVEVELVYETGTAGMDQSTWRAIEIWTRNRIYSVDWKMKCVAVTDRKTDARVPNHTFLGCILSGGQRQASESIEISYPCPRPGYEAVFEHPKRRGFMTTSQVERVVMRLRVLTVPHEHLSPTWKKLTGPGD
ncbi:MAG: hypothetical protein OEY14_06440 [Myxococcales bacterium]|nr:hypothetical protein [Myxococcales bacterium]